MKSKDQRLLEEAYEQTILNEGFINWLQGLMQSDISTVWGAFKAYVGSTLYKEMIDAGFSMLAILVSGLLMIGVVAKDKFVEVFQSVLKKLKDEKIQKLVEKLQQDPTVMDLVKVLQSAKEDPSKEGIAKRKEAAKELNRILRAELASVHSASSDIGTSVQKRTFDALKRSPKISTPIKPSEEDKMGPSDFYK